MTQSNLWPSMTGEIVRLEKRTGANAEYASLTIECKPNGEGKTWRRDAVAFDQVMTDLLALGIGARVYVRGPLRSINKSTESGVGFKVTTMTVRHVEHKPMAVTEDISVEAPLAVQNAQDIAAVTDARPALPEGATEATHQLYTKKDGSKAWRKRPAAKTVAAVETPVAVTEEVPVVAETPAAVETVALEAPVAKAVAQKPVLATMLADVGEETAMAAALRKALMNA